MEDTAEEMRQSNGLSANEHEPSLAQSLCLTCGLCCDGTLFDWAKLAQSDDDAALGAAEIMPIVVNGKRKFTLPCHHHQNRVCAIYQTWRPNVCHTYECKLLKQYARGEVSHEQALEIIQQTLWHKAEVKAQLLSLAGPTEQGLRDLWRDAKSAVAKLDSATARQRSAPVFLNYIALQVRLSRYFKAKKSSQESA